MKEKETNDALKETTEYFNGDDLAASVFISKYAKKDETTPDDMHRRMAREYARIEKQFGGKKPLTEEEIYEQFKDFKYIIPAGSVMSGLGNEEYQGSLSNCFKAGTKVHTVNKGVVNIESVEIGDIVISQDGNRHKVSQLHKTPVSDKIIYDLKCFRTPKITCTDNHKFLSISKEQINLGESVKENPISYLRVGDYIAIPNNYTESDDITIDVLDYISNNEIYGGSTYTLDKYDNEFVYFKSSHKQLDPIKRYWHIDDDFCYFMGLWYGDGCVFSDRTDRVRVNKLNISRKESKSIIHGITFTFGTHEKKLIEFTKTYGDRLFGKEGKIQQSNNDKSTQVVYHSGIVGIVFEKLFGSFSYGKKLWNGFQELSNNHVISLLCGLIDSDGTITKAGDIRVVLINDSLVNSFYHLARTRGLLVGKSSSLIKSPFDKEKEIETSRLDFDRTFIKYIKNNKFYSDSRILEAKEKSNKYNPEFYIERDGYTLVRISDKIKNTENIEYVYNIGVDDVHSYNVEGVVCMNCFVIGSPADSYASIMRYREFQIQLMKRRGGVGKDISNLRPSGAPVKNAAKTSTGPVSFMEVDSELTKEVAQDGRRGAELISISCLHPDTDQFIEKKQDLSKVTGANISVQFTDEFMECVLEDKLYLQRFPINTDVTDIDITTLPLNEKVWIGKKCFKLIKATDLWKQFVHCSWKTAEPGVMFCDKHWDLSPDSVYEEYKGVTTNPCGEIFMGPYDSCRLMHINLASLIDNPYTTEASINRKKLYETSYNNMVLCDDLVELELEHVQEIIEHIKSTYTDDCYNELELWNRIYKTGKSSRRAGCGATGLGDAIAMLGFGLGDESGREAESVMFRTKFIAELQAQVDLAKERGTFVGYDFNKEFVKIGDSYKGKNRFFNFIVELYEAGYVPKQLMLDMEKYGRRNVSWSTLAPVGSASLLTQTTSGLEPLFSPFYKRRKKISKPTDKVDFIDDNGEKFSEFFVVHKPLKDWIIGFGSNYDKTKDFSEQATDENLDIWFKESPWYGSSAEELTPEEHILSQAIAQKYTTHSISKTINLPETATEEEVSKLFIDGWKNDCKGLTIYRANCRQGILVKTDKKESNCNGTLVHSAPKRPKTLTADVKRFKNGGDKWIACVGLMNGQPYEIFTGLSEKLNIPDYVKEAEIIKSKIDKEVLNDETGLMEMQKVSRYDIRYINDKSEKVTVENLGQVFNPIFYNYNKLISGLFRHGMPIEYAVSTIKSLNFDNESINSWKNGVVRILKTYLKDGEVKGEVCPECGAKIVRENGCKRCGANCGWSACS